jgi:hypothetical protein
MDVTQSHPKIEANAKASAPQSAIRVSRWVTQ